VYDAITQHASNEPPMNYLDPNLQLAGDQETHFRESANIAVERAVASYREGGGSMEPPFSDPTQLLVAQQQFLDVINQALDERNEPRQTQLSQRDQDTVKQMLVDSNRRGGGANTADEEVEYRRDSTTGGGFFDNLFGGGTMTRSDAEAAAIRGGRDRSEFDSNRTGGGLGGRGTGGTGGTGSGPGGRTGGTTGGTGGGAGGGSNSLFRAGDEVEVRRRSTTGGGFMDNLFGGSAAIYGGSTGGGGGSGQTETMEFRGASTSAGGFFDNLFGGSDVQVSTRTTGGTSNSPFAAGTGAVESRAAVEAAARSADQQSGQTGAQSAGRAGGMGATGGQSLAANRAGEEADDDLTFGLDETDLDELALRLYDRLRSRLRRELLVDRERAGLLTDFR
jgi:hypothetical protein